MILSRLGLNGRIIGYIFFYTAIVSIFIWHSSISTQKFIRRNCKLIFIYGNGSDSLMCSASHGEFRIFSFVIFFFSSAMNKCAIMLMTIIMTHMNNKQHTKLWKKKVFLYWWLSNVMSASDAFRNTDFELFFSVRNYNFKFIFFGKKNILCMRLLVD